MSTPLQTKCQTDLKGKVDALPDNLATTLNTLTNPLNGLPKQLADEKTKLETLTQRVDTLDTNASVANLSCRMVDSTSSPGLGDVLPGGNDFVLCQPTTTWDTVTTSGTSQLQLTWKTQLPTWWTSSSADTRFCTPLHARANEDGRLFDADPTKAIVCTGGTNGSMSRSNAVAHDLRTIRDRFCA
jgi:hypothetical protein